jgi:hypothetical protein
MPQYRFYAVNPAGHIAKPPADRELPDDASAVEEAKKLLNGEAIEIWQGARVVAHLDPE